MITNFCATDKRSAITGGNACRADRSREAAKRPGYMGLAPDRPGSDHLMYWSFRGSHVKCPMRSPPLEVTTWCTGHFGFDPVELMRNATGTRSEEHTSELQSLR